MKYWFTSCSFISAVTLSYSALTACTQHINTHAHLEVKCTPTPPNCDEGICFTQGLTQRAGTSSVVLTLWSGCPLFWPSWLCLSTMGKRQTVNYFVHITHVPQLRQEHLVTVPEITVPQWRTRKVRQMEGQRRKSRAASHPLLGFFSFHDSKTQWKVEFHYLSQRCVPATLTPFHQLTETHTRGNQ